MCGRSSQRTDLNKLARWLNIHQPDLPNLKPRYNLGPAQEAVTIIGTPEGPRFEVMVWGISLRSAEAKKAVINLRLDTLVRGSFRKHLLRQRCLFPVDGFYEWKTEGAVKRPFRYEPKDEE